PLAAQGDPHAVALVADADTCLRLGHPNQNQGSASYLRIRSSGNNRALVHFDQERIEAIIAGGSLVTAQLELYIESNADNWTPDGGEVAIHRLSSPWDELRATWKCAEDTDIYNSVPDCADPWDGGTFELDVFEFQFDQMLVEVSDRPPEEVAVLEDLGPNAGCSGSPAQDYPRSVPVEVSLVDVSSRLMVTPLGTLPAGHR
ncbi:MAG: DNRLRE domain-containing protein, partial [bacterium]|nr:DNRLRE domain-containing protein [bacterium]